VYKLLIITESQDTAINKICNWLNHYQLEYTRFNSENLINSFKSISLNNFEEDKILIRYMNKIYNLLEFDLIFFRRGFLSEIKYFNPADFSNKEAAKAASECYSQELTSILNFIYYRIKDRSINLPCEYNIDKLIGMCEARQVGFKVSSSNLFHPAISLDKSKKYVIKPNSVGIRSFSYEPLFLKSEHIFLSGQDSIHSPHTLIQLYDEKVYELRVFYFINKMFVCAIMSQQDDRSKDNSRTGVKGIRYIPYRLQREVQMRIHRLMKNLNLKSGSLDFIVSPSGELIFLEVNPAGMFDYVGSFVGISLEKFVADQLINYGKKIKKSN